MSTDWRDTAKKLEQAPPQVGIAVVDEWRRVLEYLPAGELVEFSRLCERSGLTSGVCFGYLAQAQEAGALRIYTQSVRR